MERNLTINLLKKQRNKIHFRFSYRHLFYALALVIYLAFNWQQFFHKNSRVEDPQTIENEHIKEKKTASLKNQQKFFSVFFNSLNLIDTKNTLITEINYEKNYISLLGKTVNSTELNKLILLLNKKNISATSELIELHQKEDLEFFIKITSKIDFDFSEPGSLIATDKLQVKDILTKARLNNLTLENIKPEDSFLVGDFAGSYSELIKFLLEINKSHLPINSFQIHPEKNQLQLHIQIAGNLY